MKKNVWLICALFMAALVVSCSSDDDNIPAEEAELAGTWQLQSVHLTEMNEDTPMTDGCFVSYIAGYNFIDTKDKPMKVVLTDAFPKDIPDGDFWFWSGDINQFDTTQDNPTMPYDFALHPENIEVEKVNGQWQMTFKEELSNGSKGAFTLVKKDIDTEQNPVVTQPDDSDYVCHIFEGNPKPEEK